MVLHRGFYRDCLRPTLHSLELPIPKILPPIFLLGENLGAHRTLFNGLPHQGKLGTKARARWSVHYLRESYQHARHHANLGYFPRSLLIYWKKGIVQAAHFWLFLQKDQYSSRPLKS